MADDQKKMAVELAREDEERDAAERTADQEATFITPLEQEKRDAGESPRTQRAPQPVGYDGHQDKNSFERKGVRRGFLAAGALVALLGIGYLGWRHRDNITDYFRSAGNGISSMYRITENGIAHSYHATADSWNQFWKRETSPATAQETSAKRNNNIVSGRYCAPSQSQDISPVQDESAVAAESATVTDAAASTAGQTAGKKSLEQHLQGKETNPKSQQLIDHDDDPSTPGITAKELKAKYQKVLQEKGNILEGNINYDPGTPLFAYLRAAVETQGKDVLAHVVEYALAHKARKKWTAGFSSYQDICGMVAEDQATFLEPFLGVTVQEYLVTIQDCGTLLAEALHLPALKPGEKVELYLEKETK